MSDIWKAAEDGDIESVQRFIDDGVDVNKRDNSVVSYKYDSY